MRRSLALALVALVLGAGIAYAAFTYTIRVPARVEVQVAPLTPGLEITPAGVDFGGINPGTKGELRTLTVVNRGGVPLTLLTISSPNLPPGITLLSSQLPESGSVDPGKSWTVWVQVEVGAAVPEGVKTFTIRVTAE